MVTDRATTTEEVPTVTDDDLAARHLRRFRRVSNRYPRTVAEAYGGDIAAADADSDEEVADRVREWELSEGIEPRDWYAIGREDEGRDTLVLLPSATDDPLAREDAQRVPKRPVELDLALNLRVVVSGEDALRLIDADPGQIGVDLTLSALSHPGFGRIAVRMHSEAELVEARWVNYDVSDDSGD